MASQVDHLEMLVEQWPEAVRNSMLESESPRDLDSWSQWQIWA